MDKAVNFIDKYMNGGNNEKDDEVKVEGVTIPKGFYYVGGTKTDGIVISDNPADENIYSKEKHADQANIPGDGLVGIQFVWVPVENPEDFKRYPSYKDGSYQNLDNYYEPYEYGYPKEEEEYNLMKLSVEENKGFYVARYEAGIETIDNVERIVSKKGVEVYIGKWGNSAQSIGTEGAVAKAQGMYNDKNKYAVTSTLIYGIQWDAIMAWIDPAYKTSSCESNSFVINSDGKANYGESTVCGSSDNYRVNNIYDLAGNIEEWTMEAGDADTRVFRGGGMYSDQPASNRLIESGSQTDVPCGFRIALYL